MPFSIKENSIHATQSAFIWTRLLNVPFWVLLNILPIILYKDLNISPWMVSAMIIIKPASALLASYWSAWIHERKDRLLSNIIIANVIRYIPFLLIPWIQSPALIIVAFGFYMMLSRGVMPAWMEIFKLNLEKTTRSRVFSYGSALDYFCTALLPIGLGLILDDYGQSWRFLFPITAFLGLISTLFILKIPQWKLDEAKASLIESFCIKKEVAKPWKDTLKILRNSTDFFQYQLGFFLGGAGLMVMQSVIPMFFVDTLHLSYTKLLLALGLFKAIGYALASPLCIRLFNQWNIFKFSGLVSLAFGIFPLLLITAEFNATFIYLAYFLYGCTQAGSELSWHMSGPHFSQEQDSAPYSTSNILLVGLRGCIAPLAGSILFSFTNSTVVLLAGALFCLLSSRYLKSCSELRSNDLCTKAQTQRYF